MKTIVIQNADRIVKPKDFEEYKNTNGLHVHGTFYTIQGEGPHAGRPAFFIRLAGCNFGDKEAACNFCDTSFHFDKGVSRSVNSLMEAYAKHCKEYAPPPVMVITGGEPLLQANVLQLIQLAMNEDSPYYHNSTIQIETNGTQKDMIKKCLEAGAEVVVSPKTVKGRYANMLIDGVETEYEAIWYKFVVSADPKNPHHSVPDWAPVHSTYVSPMTVYKKEYAGEVSSAWDHDLIDKEATRSNYAYAARLAMEKGFRVSTQMHTFLDIA